MNAENKGLGMKTDSINARVNAGRRARGAFRYDATLIGVLIAQEPEAVANAIDWIEDHKDDLA